MVPFRPIPPPDPRLTMSSRVWHQRTLHVCLREIQTAKHVSVSGSVSGDRESPDGPHVYDARIQGGTTNKTPQVSLLVSHQTGEGSLLWTSDTGAEVSVIGSRAAERIGIDTAQLTQPAARLLAAGGHQLKRARSFQCTLTMGVWDTVRYPPP